ncbi:peptide chain release factor N(5)-glutamine methyltransferase [Paenibacillus sp. MAHUQ-46]|uniref:Release factor glutamine methyltransferase n=2 Tax=Paenibacillus TaxID=44249 RepID=A0A934J232_9BACL|nr:peptide chain release factor N(5)-glutamine methyltransferase [Paenibacillus roseus]MBJ6361380.1 peptide chain release factor N(5)-glutamine methyltransferase [Paenibacillus roseus]
MTLREACLQASSFLSGAGVDEARANAELLLMHLLGMERAALIRDWGELLPIDIWEQWTERVRRRAAGEPVQYIIGEQWFYGLPFTVRPGVLIPRPETELLVEAVLAAADELWPEARGAQAGRAAGGEAGGDEAASQDGAGPAAVQQGRVVPTVIDVGTGSGAIAVTLAAQRHAWRVCASDLSEDALEVARTNAARHGVGGRVQFVRGDLLGPFVQQRPGSGGSPGELAGLRADVLVSNPPYIPAGDLPHLQREVRDYEPRLALDGGADGLDPYRRMLAQLPELARLPRLVAFELGMGQAQQVAQLLRDYGAWEDIRIITDYGGIERHVIALSAK